MLTNRKIKKKEENFVTEKAIKVFGEFCEVFRIRLCIVWVTTKVSNRHWHTHTYNTTLGIWLLFNKPTKREKIENILLLYGFDRIHIQKTTIRYIFRISRGRNWITANRLSKIARHLVSNLSIWEIIYHWWFLDTNFFDPSMKIAEFIDISRWSIKIFDTVLSETQFATQ